LRREGLPQGTLLVALKLDKGGSVVSGALGLLLGAALLPAGVSISPKSRIASPCVSREPDVGVLGNLELDATLLDLQEATLATPGAAVLSHQIGIGRKLDLDAGRAPSFESPIAIPLVPGSPEMAVLWNHETHAAVAILAEATFARPAVSRRLEVRVGRNFDGLAGFACLAIATRTFPAVAVGVEECIRWNFDLDAPIARPPVPTITVPTATESIQVSVSGDRDQTAEVAFGSAVATITLPSRSVGLHMRVVGYFASRSYCVL